MTLTTLSSRMIRCRTQQPRMSRLGGGRHSTDCSAKAKGARLIRKAWLSAATSALLLVSCGLSAQETSAPQTWISATEIDIDVSQFRGDSDFRWFSVPTLGRAECSGCEDGSDVTYQLLRADDHFATIAGNLFRTFGTRPSTLVPSFGHESHRTGFLNLCESSQRSCTASIITLPDGRPALSAIETRTTTALSGSTNEIVRHILQFQSQDAAVLMSATSASNDVAAHNVQALFDQIIGHYPAGTQAAEAPQSTPPAAQDIPPFPAHDLPVDIAAFAGGPFTDWSGQNDRAGANCWDCGLARVSVGISYNQVEDDIWALRTDSPNMAFDPPISAFADDEYIQALQRSCDHYAGVDQDPCDINLTTLPDGRPTIVMTQLITEEVWNLEDRYVPINQQLFSYVFQSQSSVITINGTAQTAEMAQQNADALLEIALPYYPIQD